ncbi:hypothetical protein CFBP3846_P100008 (plasmid) [Pseudomonas syringae pv. avii]|uniref:Uncharacterized protein n=2 Tax=Pseudomonas syringae TaxID=317 RepID=A0A2K4X474_PSESX|nr:hypothetical protein CFBP3846_P100008 [Pseudomonas syringae pv. avii]SOS43066.1 hypothetical protein CFBP3840_P400038 [Pseudomonas syringae]SPE17131.1 hypothetical protein PSCFBP2116_P300024 [Pseudomonas syringae]
MIDSRVICLAALDQTIKTTVRSALLPLFSIHKSTQLTDSRDVSSESLLLDPGTVCKRTKQALFGKRLPLVTKLDAQLSHGFHPVELGNSIQQLAKQRIVLRAFDVRLHCLVPSSHLLVSILDMKIRFFPSFTIAFVAHF